MVNAGCDLETTGLTPGASSILQMTWMTFDDNYKIGPKFTTFIQPYESVMERIEKALTTKDKTYEETRAAMKVNKITLEQLEKAPTIMEVRGMFYGWWEDELNSDKIIPLGHNFDAFDRQFLKVFFGYKEINKVLHYKSRQTDQVIRFLRDCGYFKELESTSLEACCEFFDIVHKAHDSFGDVFATIMLWKQLVKAMGV